MIEKITTVYNEIQDIKNTEEYLLNANILSAKECTETEIKKFAEKQKEFEKEKIARFEKEYDDKLIEVWRPLIETIHATLKEVKEAPELTDVQHTDVFNILCFLNTHSGEWKLLAFQVKKRQHYELHRNMSDIQDACVKLYKTWETQWQKMFGESKVYEARSVDVFLSTVITTTSIVVEQ